MKNFIKVILLCTALSALTACPLQTREDIQEEQANKQLKEQVSSIQRTKADNEARYNDLQNDVRSTGGRMDTLEHNMQVNERNNRQEIESLKKVLDTQNEKMKLIEQHIDATEARLTAAIQAAAQASSNAAPAATGGNGGATASAGQPKKGDNVFADAESLFARKDYKKAIVKYQAYRDKNPKGPRQAESTYKIGVCFVELGLKKDAKEFFTETIESYPATPSAKKAKFRLSQLK